MIAVLVLLGGGGSQVAALGCPMGLPAAEASAPDAAPQHHAGSHHAAAGHAEAPTDGESPDAPRPDRDGCELAMGCGSAVPLPTDVTTSPVPGTTAPSILTQQPPGSATLLPHEPPPPRLQV